jgi:hypothetical protein
MGILGARAHFTEFLVYPILYEIRGRTVRIFANADLAIPTVPQKQVAYEFPQVLSGQ